MKKNDIPTVYPDEKYEHISLTNMKYNDKLLQEAYSWLIENSVNSAFRFIVIFKGKIIIEWNEKYERSELLPIYSAAKSIYSNILGIAEYEKK